MWCMSTNAANPLELHTKNIKSTNRKKNTDTLHKCLKIAGAAISAWERQQTASNSWLAMT